MHYSPLPIQFLKHVGPRAARLNCITSGGDDAPIELRSCRMRRPWLGHRHGRSSSQSAVLSSVPQTTRALGSRWHLHSQS